MTRKESEFRAVWRQGRVYGLGNALNRVAALLLIPVLLHSLSAEEWGAYALILIFSQALSMGASVINDSMARIYYDYEEETKRCQVVGTAFVLFLMAAALLGVLAYPLAIAINGFLFDHDRYFNAVLLANFGVIFELLLGMLLIYVRLRRRPLIFVSISLARSLIQLSLSIVLVAYLGMGVMGVVIGNFAAITLLSIPAAAMMLRHTGLHYRRPVAREMTRLAVPMVPAWFVRSSFNLIERTMLNQLTTTATVGVYAVGRRLTEQFDNLLTLPFAHVWGVHLLEVGDSVERAKELNRVLNLVMFVLTGASLTLSLFCLEILQIIAAPEFWDVAPVIPIMALTGIVGVPIYHFERCLLQKKQTVYMPIINWSVVAFSIGIFFIMIPIHPLWGTACAGLMVFLFKLSLTVFFVARCSDVHRLFPWGGVATYILLAIITYGVSLWLIGDTVSLAGIAGKLALLAIGGTIAFYSPAFDRDERRAAIGMANGFAQRLGLNFGGR